MKALSVIQPWATLLAIGAKRIETRSWRTLYRGRVAIHASRAHRAEERLMIGVTPFTGVLAEHFQVATQRELLECLPHGAVIATGDLVACIATEVLLGGIIQPPLSDQELAFGDFSPRRYGWIFRDVRELPEPMPARGSLGLWDWDPALWGLRERDLALR